MVPSRSSDGGAATRGGGRGMRTGVDRRRSARAGDAPDRGRVPALRERSCVRARCAAMLAGRRHRGCARPGSSRTACGPSEAARRRRARADPHRVSDRRDAGETARPRRRTCATHSSSLTAPRANAAPRLPDHPRVGAPRREHGRPHHGRRQEQQDPGGGSAPRAARRKPTGMAVFGGRRASTARARVRGTGSSSRSMRPMPPLAADQCRAREDGQRVSSQPKGDPATPARGGAVRGGVRAASTPIQAASATAAPAASAFFAANRHL